MRPRPSIAQRPAPAWSRRTAADRALHPSRGRQAEAGAEIAATITLEEGSRCSIRFEMRLTIDSLHWYARRLAAPMATGSRSGAQPFLLTMHQPVGVCGAIIPECAGGHDHPQGEAGAGDRLHGAEAGGADPVTATDRRGVPGGQSRRPACSMSDGRCLPQPGLLSDERAPSPSTEIDACSCAARPKHIKSASPQARQQCPESSCLRLQSRPRSRLCGSIFQCRPACISAVAFMCRPIHDMMAERLQACRQAEGRRRHGRGVSMAR